MYYGNRTGLEDRATHRTLGRLDAAAAHLPHGV